MSRPGDEHAVTVEGMMDESHATDKPRERLPVDARGRLCIQSLSDIDAREAAMLTCAALATLLRARVSVIAASSTADATGFNGVVTLREVAASGVAYKSATVAGATVGEAVARAVIRALDVDQSFADAAARRWSNEAGVRSITVVRDEQAESFGPSDDAYRHERLAKSMPTEGILSVDAADGAYRVLRLPNVAIVATLAVGGRDERAFSDWIAEIAERYRC